MPYVIYWGKNKDGSPFFESNMTMKDLVDEPTNPYDDRVMKFTSESKAQSYLEITYDIPDAAEVIDLDTAVDYYNEYARANTLKIN